MTKRGIIYIILLLFLAVLSFGTGIKELHMITYCMAAILAFALISVLFAALFLRVKHSISETIVSRRDIITFRIKLKGFVLLPITINAYIAVPGKKRRRVKDAECYVLTKLPGIFRKDIEIKLPCNNKGLWYVGIKKFRVFDLFGLFSFPLFFSRKSLSYRYEIQVHPKAYTPENESTTPSAKIGVSAAALKDSNAGDSVADSRQYVYGDPFKRINWKQTARTRELYVRNYELEENPQVLIITDMSASVSPVENSDIAADLAVSLNKYYINEGASVHNMVIRLNKKSTAGEATYYVQNDTDFDNLDSALMVTDAGSAVNDALHIPQLDTAFFTSAVIIHIISADPSVSLLKSLSNLKENDYLVTCLVPLADDSVSGVIRARGEESGFAPTVFNEPADIVRLLGGRI